MEKIRRFFSSDWFTAFLIIAAGFIVVTGNEIAGTIIFVVICGLVMALCEDFLPALQVILITTCFAIRCKHSYDDFIRFWWLVPGVAVLILSHFFIYKAKFTRGNCFFGILATSIAVTLGGLGIITAKEYFAPVSLFYIFLLGFAMLIVHMYMNSALKIRDGYVFSERFAKMMAAVIVMICICLAEEYLSRLDELNGTFDILPFQWRNNGSTMLMLAMPFAFYLSAKKFGWFFVGMLAYAAIILTGSRGGMIFGLVELGICFTTMFILDKRHRPIIGAIFFGCLIVAFLMRHFLIDIVSYTIQRLLSPTENAIRLQLIPRGIEDFKSNILFGRGIGYMGNNDVHNNAEFTLCWYHCSAIQVAGSFGTVGIVAFVYQFIKRNLLIWKKATLFNMTIFLSYISLELMSLVNPGIFCPVPYLLLVVLYLIVIEKSNDTEPQVKVPILKKFREKRKAKKQKA